MLRVELPTTLLTDAELHAHESILQVEESVGSGDEPLYAYAGHAALGNLSGGNCGGSCAGASHLRTAIWEYQATAGEYGAIGAGISTRYYYGDTDPVYQFCPATCTSDSSCGAAYACRSISVRSSGGSCGLEEKRCINEHVSHVAASIGMHGSFIERGTLFSSVGTYQNHFYVANDADSAGLDWLLSQPVIYANRSQGMVGTPRSYRWRLADWAARYDFLFLTKAAGNQPDTLATDCVGWNSMCVGSMQYQNWQDRSDDRRSTYSRYINPTENPGLERPHIMGVGDYDSSGGNTGGIYLADIFPLSTPTNAMTNQDRTSVANRGTSFAAPMLLSLAQQAHLYEGWFSALSYPITKKAVLMVGSKDANADGPILKGTKWEDSPDGEDGAGAPDMSRVKTILDNNHYQYIQLAPSMLSSCGTNCQEYAVASVTVPKDYALRAGLAYNSCPSSSLEVNELLTDYDLFVSEQNCGFFCFPSKSVTTNNEVEMVFVGSTSSARTFDLKIRFKTGESIVLCGTETSEPVALAWDVYYDPMGVGGS